MSERRKVAGGRRSLDMPGKALKRRKNDHTKTKDELVEEIRDLRERVRTLQTELLLDDLTGLHNARHLRGCLAKAIETFEAGKEKPGLLFIDVDYFKMINEKHGHQVGGELLNQVGRTIARLIRVDDVAFRYGGDEFVVLVNGGEEGAMGAGERLRAAIETTPFRVNGLLGDAIVQLTISVGVRILRAGDTPKTIIDEADRAMFEAKRRSRNTLVAA
jgi:diguanylate cyclase (GGDEF)-like protein